MHKIKHGPLEERFTQPVGFQWGHFQRIPGRQIRYGYCLPESKKIDYSVVDFPGLNDPIEKHFEAHRELQANGAAVFAIEWMGQGGSARYFGVHDQRRHSVGFDVDLDDAAYFLEYIMRPVLEKYGASHRPKVLKAHSMGGHLALRSAARLPDIFNKLVISAPLVQINFGAVPHGLRLPLTMGIKAFLGGENYAPGMTDWKQKNPLRAVGTDRYSSDPKRSALHNHWMAANPVGGPTNQWLVDVHRSIRTLYKELSDIRTPAFVGVPMDESVVDSQATISALENCHRADIQIFEKAKHELFQEADPYRSPMMNALLTPDP